MADFLFDNFVCDVCSDTFNGDARICASCGGTVCPYCCTIQEVTGLAVCEECDVDVDDGL